MMPPLLGSPNRIVEEVSLSGICLFNLPISLAMSYLYDRASHRLP